MKEGSGVQSLDRAFDILELLSEARDGASLTDIAARLGLHTSTVYRLLSALRKRGYAEQTASRGVYRLGLELVRLCGPYLNSLELKTEAEPAIRQLSQATGQTVFLAILQNDEVVYIDKVEQFNSLRKYSIIGQRRPLHCTSLGKALLLGMSEPEIVGLYCRAQPRGAHARDDRVGRGPDREPAGLPQARVDSRRPGIHRRRAVRGRSHLRLQGEGHRGGQRLVVHEDLARGDRGRRSPATCSKPPPGSRGAWARAFAAESA